LPWSIQNPVALVFDEYDAGRPDVMFVIQRVLEAEGNFTLLDKNKVIKQNKYFRLFATSNTVGFRGYNWTLSWDSANKPGSNG
jgi:cobaltochelatase CobS